MFLVLFVFSSKLCGFSIIYVMYVCLTFSTIQLIFAIETILIISLFKEAEARRKKFNIISGLVDMTRGSERMLDPTGATCLLTEHRW